MSDTSPSELARIVNDEKDFRTYVVLTLQESRNEMVSHKIEDRRQFEELKAGQGNVSSTVGKLERAKYKIEGSWSTIVVIAVVLISLLDIALKIAEHVK